MSTEIIKKLRELVSSIDGAILDASGETFDPLNNGGHLMLAMTGLMQDGWQITHISVGTSEGVSFFCYAVHTQSSQIICYGGCQSFYSAIICTLLKVVGHENYHH